MLTLDLAEVSRKGTPRHCASCSPVSPFTALHLSQSHLLPINSHSISGCWERENDHNSQVTRSLSDHVLFVELCQSREFYHNVHISHLDYIGYQNCINGCHHHNTAQQFYCGATFSHNHDQNFLWVKCSQQSSFTLWKSIRSCRHCTHQAHQHKHVHFYGYTRAMSNAH